jgi:hypothetical protein
MGPNCQVGSRSGCTQTRTVAMGLTTWITQPIGNGLVWIPLTQHFNITTFPSIKDFCSDCIVTWSVCRLCRSGRFFTSRPQIWHQTNIRWVAIKNPQISKIIGPSVTATQRMSVRLQIWKRQMKERPDLNNLHTDHITIWLELKFFIATKSVGTVKLKPWSGEQPA